VNRKQIRILLTAILASLTLCACDGGLPTLAETGAGAGASKKGPGRLSAWAASGSKLGGKAEKRAGQARSNASNSQALAPRASAAGKVTKKSSSRAGRSRLRSEFGR